MKTLVIHPDDPSTDFLSPIYSGKNWTILQRCYDKDYILEQIQDHDRIIMMGHGTPDGLMSVGQFAEPYVINSSLVNLLKTKQQNLVAIWCNADRFMNKYGLKGFFTGMIVSEMYEAKYFGIKCSYNDIEQSNTEFAKAIQTHIDCFDVRSMWFGVVSDYYSETNPIIQYNMNNIFYV